MNASRLVSLAYCSAIVVLFAAVTMTMPSSAPLLEPDSGGYLSFSATRSAGYPAFLSLLEWLGLTRDEVPFAQFGLYALSLAALGLALANVMQSKSLAFLVIAVVIAARPVHDLHAQILSDSLTLSLLNGIAAAILVFGRTHRLAYLALTSLFIGLAIAVRPASWAFVPILPLMVALLAGWRVLFGWRSIAALLVPIVLSVAAERIYYGSAHGWERQSLLPLHVFGKGAMLSGGEGLATSVEGADPTSVAALWQAAQGQFEPVRDLAAQAVAAGHYCRMVPNYEVFAQYQLGLPARRELGAFGNRAMQQIGFARILDRPGEYLALTWVHFKCLWSLGMDGGVETVAAYQAWIRTVRPLPFEAEMETLLHPVPPGDAESYLGVLGILTTTMTVVAGIAAVLSALGLAFLFVRGVGGPLIRLSAIFALLTNGYFWLVAMTGVAVTRYTLAMLVPIGLMLSLLALSILFELCHRWHHRRPAVHANAGSVGDNGQQEEARDHVARGPD